MYRKESEGWFKHIDFILIDMICLQVAFYLAYVLKGLGVNPYADLVYRNMAMVLEFADLAAMFMLDTLTHVTLRGRYRELIATAGNVLAVGLIGSAYLFFMQEGAAFSRLMFGITLVLYFVFAYASRFAWKKVLASGKWERNCRSLLIVTTKADAQKVVEKVGSYTVLTTSLNYASAKQLLFKRVMDIAGGLVGCLLTCIIFIFIAPIIYISSPGPIFFSQERIGKNGKKFKIYKFRSMYMDAEARKAELMKQNRVADGKMFKLDFDPRVIGNKILPDGTKKTGIGNFIRVTSLDEFPQFFNVLKGDMSIVGTRPPLPGEVSEYELHHRARLAIKPGITGMWQVSGRSDITDFEEVVRLDTKYIREWSPALDIKILFKTVKTVLGKEGSM